MFVRFLSISRPSQFRVKFAAEDDERKKNKRGKHDKHETLTEEERWPNADDSIVMTHYDKCIAKYQVDQHRRYIRMHLFAHISISYELT